MRYRATVAAIVLVVGVAAYALAQSSRPSEPKQDEAATKRHEETNKQLQAIAAELDAIHDQQASTEQRAAKAESDQRKEVWVNRGLAFLAAVAAIIGVLTLRAIRNQVTANVNAAAAATASVDIARRSLLLLNQPWLDTSKWQVLGEKRGPSTPDGMGGHIRAPLEGLLIGFDVVNKGPTPATIYEIEVRDSGSGSPPVDYSVTGDVGNVLIPDAAYPYQAHINNLSRRQIESYEEGNGVPLTIEGTIHFGDLFARRDANDVQHGPRLRHFGRLCLLKSNGRSEFHPIAGAERVEPELGADETPKKQKDGN